MRNVMRTKIKFAALVLGAVAGIVCLIYLGPTVLFLLFHSDWQPVDHLLTVQNDTAILRLEVVDGNGAVLWAIENPSEASIAFIDYGVLPEGFVQRVPMGHEPRKLAKGKPLGFSYCDSRAIAHMKASISLAMAVTTTLEFLPRDDSRRKRLQSRT